MTTVQIKARTIVRASPFCNSKLARCPQCYRLLCKRIPMHNENEEVYGFHIKHRGLEIITIETMAVFTCPSCHTKVLINSKDGSMKQYGRQSARY